MRIITAFLIVLGFVSCRNEEKNEAVITIDSVKVKDIYTDSILSIRAIEILDDGNLAFAANNNTYGLYDANTKKWQVKQHEYDSLELHFRSVAHTASDFFMLTIENPALLFKTGDAGNMELVYKEENDSIFYDAMKFWNNREGIAIGDPIGGCMSVVITRNGGQTWEKLPCDVLPKAKESEGAFAASNSNIAIVGEKTWVATGGKFSRILYSPDKGKRWEVFDTPIIQGEPTTGLYSIDFYDEMNGFGIGGDYKSPEKIIKNKIITSDGGRTWQRVSDGQEPGYRSCVKYVPNSGGNALVAVGFNGIDYTDDRGESWKHLSDESFYTIRFLNDSVAYAAGKGRISKLMFKYVTEDSE